MEQERRTAHGGKTVLIARRIAIAIVTAMEKVDPDGIPLSQPGIRDDPEELRSYRLQG
jgi:hypothetical protein